MKSILNGACPKHKVISTFVIAAVITFGASAPALAGSVTIYNCFHSNLHAFSYNSNDSVRWIAYKNGPLGWMQRITLNCATSKCQILVNQEINGTTRTALVRGSYSGSYVLIENKIWEAILVKKNDPRFLAYQKLDPSAPVRACKP